MLIHVLTFAINSNLSFIKVEQSGMWYAHRLAQAVGNSF